MGDSPSRPPHSLDIASFLACLEEHGVTIRAGFPAIGYWALIHPGPPERRSYIAFGGYATYVRFAQIRAVLVQLGISESDFWRKM